MTAPFPNSSSMVDGGQEARREESGMAPLTPWTVALLVGASFGASLAYLVPMVFTLALRVDQIAPGNQASLGYIIGIGALFTLLAAPLTGILSDRTRSRWGRRRPFTVAGALVGLAAVPLLAYATDLVSLGVGWVIASVGWGTAAGSIANYQADRLPPGQRGKVSGLTGMVSQIAPVAGVILVGGVTVDPLLVVLLPMLVGTPLVVLFVVSAHEEDSRGVVPSSRLSPGAVLRSFGFRPRDFPDFAWNWLGRFVFFTGISLTTTYGTFFYASRLGIAVEDISPVVAVISSLGIVSAAVGALVGGTLSDRLGRRHPFVVGAVVIFVAGSVIMAFAHSLPVIMIGAALSSSGVATFLAVNQAMVLDVLPHRETQAGRFMAITAFSQKIPSGLAPLAAPLILAVGSMSAPNYTALYLTTASLVLVGGVIIVIGVRAVR